MHINQWIIVCIELIKCNTFGLLSAINPINAFSLRLLFYRMFSLHNRIFFPMSEKQLFIIFCCKQWRGNVVSWYGSLPPSSSLQYFHYDDIIMSAIASQITSLAIVYSTVYSDVDQRKHQSSASLAFVWGIHRGPVNSPHKWPVTRKMFPFDDVIMW